MPMPSLFMGVAATTATIGVAKTARASVDQNKANHINQTSIDELEKVKDKTEKCRKNCANAIEYLGRCKVQILDESMRLFVHEFIKLNPIELSELGEMDELQKLVLDEEAFSELEKLQSMASSIVLGITSGAMTGAFLTFGACGVAGTFSSASSGSAISSFCGASMTNGTLAFLRGASSFAGGSLVLGGLVAAPSLAVLGFVVGARAASNKEKALINQAKVLEMIHELETASQLCIGIRKRSAMFARHLWSLNCIFEQLVFKMKYISESKGPNFLTYDDNEKKVIAEAMAMAGTIKTLLDTPILNENGMLTAESEIISEKIEKCISK